MKEFIISNVSMGMFDDKIFDLSVFALDEEEFKALTDSVNVESRIGHEDIAEMTGLDFNKSPVHARIGDVLYHVQVRNGMLKYHMIKIEPKGWYGSRQSCNAEELENYIKEN